MTQPETLDKCIQQITTLKLSPTKLFKCFKRIIKALHQYSSDSEQLPPQTLIPCCLFTLPNKLAEYFNIQPQQVLQEPPEKLSVNLMVQLYLTSLLGLLTKSSDQISHIIVEGMSRNIFLLHAYPIIAKKWLKVLVTLWGESQQNINLSLRCHLVINKYLRNQNSQIYSWLLRRMYVTYFDNSKQVSLKSFEHRNFMINSLCQIIKLNESRAYYVLFGYLRSICLQIDKYNKSKGKQKISLIGKLYSVQILNCFRLFSSVVTRILSQQLTSLVYPQIQMIAAFVKLSENPQYMPLKIQLLDILLTIMQELGLYIPAANDILIRLLSSKMFMSKLKKKGDKIQQNINLISKISTGDLKDANIANQLFNLIMNKLYKFGNIVAKNVSGCQILKRLGKTLKPLISQYSFSGYKDMMKKFIKNIDHDNQLLYKYRSKMQMSIIDEKLIELYERKRYKNNSNKLQVSQQFQQLKEAQQQMLKTKLVSQSGNYQKEEEHEESQINSDWEEASQGASQFQQQPVEEQEKEEKDVSYEGDPEDPQQLIMQWSEHSWSSQNDVVQ